MLSVQDSDSPGDCGGAKQLFLSKMSVVAARFCCTAAAWEKQKKSETQRRRARREIAEKHRQILVRAVLQRVSRAKVIVEGRVTGEIGAGLMILLGVGREDASSVAATFAEKCANLRIFEDEQGKMNRSLLDVKGSALVVSQFTLYGDARGQRRPSFISAAPPELAKALYEEFCEALRKLGVSVATGIFQAMMSVELVNEGPVTILLDSDKTF